MVLLPFVSLLCYRADTSAIASTHQSRVQLHLRRPGCKTIRDGVQRSFGSEPPLHRNQCYRGKDATGKVKTLNWNVSVVSLNPSSDNTGSSTAISVVFLLGNTYFLPNHIQLCGQNRAQAAARDTLANLDHEVQGIVAAK